MKKLTLLALSGSLRRQSLNAAALQALGRLAPAHIEIVTGQIRDLPLFNPDREGEDLVALMQLKRQLAHADGLVIASPEYAHGISGPMKNALDWLVSGVEFPGKPIMLINTSPRASHAQDALREVLTTMSGNVVESATVTLPLLGSGLDTPGILASRELCKLLQQGLASFCEAVNDQHTGA